MIKKKITSIEKAKLEKQLAILTKDCEAAQERMTAAKREGDVSENAELDAAREDFLKYSVRAREIDDLLSNCEVVGETRGNVFDIGSIFQLYKRNPETTELEDLGMFSLGSSEDYLGHIIGISSPLGKAIKGNTSGFFTIQSEFIDRIEYKVEKLDSSYSEEFLKLIEEEE